MGGRGIGTAVRACGALLLLAALALRLVAPDGWMIAAGDGGPKIVICTGHMPPAPAGHPDGHDGGGDSHGDHPCVFAGAHAPPAPSPLAVALAPGFAAFDAPVPSRMTDQRPGLGLAAPPPPSQGPPALS